MRFSLARRPATSRGRDRRFGSGRYSDDGEVVGPLQRRARPSDVKWKPMDSGHLVRLMLDETRSDLGTIFVEPAVAQLARVGWFQPEQGFGAHQPDRSEPGASRACKIRPSRLLATRSRVGHTVMRSNGGAVASLPACRNTRRTAPLPLSGPPPLADAKL